MPALKALLLPSDKAENLQGYPSSLLTWLPDLRQPGCCPLPLPWSVLCAPLQSPWSSGFTAGEELQGITGDCVGATNELAEISVLVGGMVFQSDGER